jgi:uncharacterized glyoxalase superfamily protein PhnB
MPTQGPSISPTLRYRDALAAIDFLVDAFGFQKAMMVPGENGTVAHAELRYGNGMIMLGSADKGNEFDRITPPPGNSAAYVVVDDADAHHDRAKAAGAEIVYPLTDQEYGSRDYAARDPEGNLWSFGTYRPTLEG